jgi:hypothetical protein
MYEGARWIIFHQSNSKCLTAIMNIKHRWTTNTAHSGSTFYAQPTAPIYLITIVIELEESIRAKNQITQTHKQQQGTRSSEATYIPCLRSPQSTNGK